MRNGIISLIITIVFFTSLLSAQATTSSSSVGVYLKTVTHDKKGNMWVGGSVWLLQGFLLRIDSPTPKAILPPGIVTVDHLLFPDSQTGIMCANNSQIYKSSDSGLTWRRVFSAGANNLNEIFFSSPRDGWVVGTEGSIYHTDDGGDTWHEQNSGVDVDLNQVVFVDKRTGWAAGWSHIDLSTGTYPFALLSTNDGGKSWTRLVDEKSMMLRNITFLSYTEGWASDDKKNSVVQTTDGGKTWRADKILGRSDWWYVKFLNPREGWAMGDAIAATRDGGKTWFLVRSVTKDLDVENIDLRDFRHVAATSWVISEPNKGKDILRSSDGGKTWKPIPQNWVKGATDEVYRAKFGHKNDNSGDN